MNVQLPSGVSRIQDPGGRPAVQLQGGGGTVVVSPVGAQVLSWVRAGRDVLWTASRPEFAPRKPVRGGVPLVFPWFGDHPTDRALPAHGFVRNQEWRLVDAGPGQAVVFETTDDAPSRAMWPHAYRLRFAVVLTDTLQLSLTITNPGATPFTCEEALHTYFAVGDVHLASVHGLERVACTEHAAAPEPHWDPGQPLRFRAETDRVFQGVPDRIVLRAPALERELTLTTRAARSAIVWNPWPAKTGRLSQMAPDDWMRFVCIESANVKQHRLTLLPGQSHTLDLVLACR